LYCQSSFRESAIPQRSQQGHPIKITLFAVHCKRLHKRIKWCRIELIGVLR
jgi:hypothetical protein